MHGNIALDLQAEQRWSTREVERLLRRREKLAKKLETWEGTVRYQQLLVADMRRWPLN